MYRGPMTSSTGPIGTGPMLSAKMPSVHSSARPPSWALHPSILPFLMISVAQAEPWGQQLGLCGVLRVTTLDSQCRRKPSMLTP